MELTRDRVLRIEVSHEVDAGRAPDPSEDSIRMYYGSTVGEERRDLRRRHRWVETRQIP